MEKKYNIYLYSNPDFLFLNEESIINIEYKQEEVKYKKSTRTFGVPEPKNLIEIEYTDEYFDATLKSLSENSFTSGSEIFVCIASYNKCGTTIEQEELSSKKIEFFKDKLIIEIDRLFLKGSVLGIHPGLKKAGIDYLSERRNWLRDSKINSIIL
jgi:hypothetical protein